MKAVREYVKTGGMIRIPAQFMETLRLAEGDEIYVRTEAARLVVVPVAPRRRVRLDAGIVDELVEREELYEPELT